MFLLAASVSIAILSDQQSLQKREAAVWQEARNSIVILLRQGMPSGQAALIDKKGLFIAAQGSVQNRTVDGKLADGRLIRLEWKATDATTQIALLQAIDWKEDGAKAIAIHSVVDRERTPVVVVLPGGPVRGQLFSTNRLGVVNPSKRMFPMGEVRFEATAQSVAGGLIFDDEGHLVGLLNATLATPQTPLSIQRIAAPQSDGWRQAIPLGGGRTKSFGPAEMTVAYTVDSAVLERVVAGFLSPSHKVQHPAIGVYCKDAPTPGALIQQVRPGSPAEKAGLQTGDVIVKMDDKVIANQFDFARFIESRAVGDTVTIVVLRGGATKTFKVHVGVMPFQPI